MKRLFLCVALFALATATAHAHESRPAYLELQQKSKDTYDLLWKIPARGPEKRLGLYVRLPDDSTIVAQTTSSFLGGAFIERSTISRSGGLAGAEIYIEGLSTTLTDVLVRIGRLDGSTQVVRLTPSVPSFVVDAAPTVMGVAKTYLVLGMQHIWKGVDHLLFVACLIMIAGTWRRILITITGFTVAHSITLALAALELVRLPVPPVEATIALSIVFLATEFARARRDTLTWRYPIAVAGSFGLLHGFGFASVLSEIGLPQTEIPAALLFFNVGVEVGQVLFVALLIGSAAVLTALGVIERNDGIGEEGIIPLRLARPVAYLAGPLAAYWVIERVAGFVA